MPAAPFTVTMDIKKMFFDPDAIAKRADAARMRNLSKAGAFVRRRARSILRRRKKASAPGQPPSVHAQSNFATLKNILFGYDPSIDGLIVGPVGFVPRKQPEQAARGIGDVPGALEHGATLPVRERLVKGKWRPAGRARWEQKLPLRTRIANYPARPFMATALALEEDTIATTWKDSV